MYILDILTAVHNCEATPDVERWAEGIHPTTLLSHHQGCSWNRWAFSVCQHHTLSSVKPLQLTSTWRHLASSQKPLPSDLPKEQQVPSHWLRQALPGHASIYIDSLQTPWHSGSNCAPGYHAWSTEDMLVSPPWSTHECWTSWERHRTRLDKKPDPQRLSSHSSAHVTLLPSWPSPPLPLHPLRCCSRFLLS